MKETAGERRKARGRPAKRRPRNKSGEQSGGKSGRCGRMNGVCGWKGGGCRASDSLSGRVMCIRVLACDQ